MLNKCLGGPPAELETSLLRFLGKMAVDLNSKVPNADIDGIIRSAELGMDQQVLKGISQTLSEKGFNFTADDLVELVRAIAPYYKEYSTQT